MTRSKAEALLEKLDALADPARGGAPAERAAAARKAAALRARFDLRAPTPRPGPIQPPRVRRPVYAAPVHGAAWEFNVKTGEASPNVRVDYYRDRANWKIEVPL